LYTGFEFLDEVLDTTTISDRKLWNIDTTKGDWLPLVELRRNVNNIYGGKSTEALKENLWIPAGEPISLDGNTVTVEYKYGDTWFSRYDCLKTYPFTKEDTN
jgi:hypothetical protein